MCRIFHSLLGVWKSDETLSLVFDILLPSSDSTEALAFSVSLCFEFWLEEKIRYL